MEQRRKTGATKISPVVPASRVTNYEEFVIVAQRKNERTVNVRVEASPAGRMMKPVAVAFPDKEGTDLRCSFIIGVCARTCWDPPCGNERLQQWLLGCSEAAT